MGMMSATLGPAFSFNFITGKAWENGTAFTVVVSADNPMMLPVKDGVKKYFVWDKQVDNTKRHFSQLGDSLTRRHFFHMQWKLQRRVI